MDDPYKIRIRPGGPNKRRPENNRALKAAYFYLLKNLKSKHTVSLLAGPKAYHGTQKCTVKVCYVDNEHEGQWRAHGRYLGRKRGPEGK